MSTVSTVHHKPLGKLASLQQRVEVTTDEPVDRVFLGSGSGKTFPVPERYEESYTERVTFPNGTYIDLASGKIRAADGSRLARVDCVSIDDKDGLELWNVPFFGEGARQRIGLDGRTEFQPKNSFTQFIINPDGSGVIVEPPSAGECLEAAFFGPHPGTHDDGTLMGSLEAGVIDTAGGVGRILGIGVPDHVTEVRASKGERGQIEFRDAEGNLRGAIKPLLDPAQYNVVL